MTIDWSDNTKRSAFRLTLQKVYPSEEGLQIFVDEVLGKNLAQITSSVNLQPTAYGLVKWAEARGRLNDVFEAFCNDKGTHASIIAELKAELQKKPLLTRTSKPAAEDLEPLFNLFALDDFADIQRAFFRAFKRVLRNDFRQVRPDYPPLQELAQIQALLATYEPKLALQFVESVIVELQRSSEEGDRDLTPLEQWRDRIAQKYNIPVEVPELTAPTACHAYLLVALKESGRVTQEGADVNVFVELRVTGELDLIEFDAISVTCPFDQVAGHVSDWIHKAEAALIPYECGRVTLELFLPCVHLEENIAAWEVQNEQGLTIALGGQRGFVVRSLEWVLNRTTQTVLTQKWRLLEHCVGANNVYDQFHLQEACPAPGTLLAFLEDSLGLRLVAKLPSDREQRKALLYEIINSAVPIALWSTEFDQFTVAELKTQVDHLLSASQLTNFADL